MVKSHNLSSCVAQIVATETVNTVEFFLQKTAGPVLLAYGGESFLSIAILHFPQLEGNLDEFSYENLTDIQHGASVQKIAWSPKTSLLVHPVGIILCTAALDCQVRLFRLDNKNEVTVKTLGEHSSFVNDCAFEPLRGEQVASVGDDKKLRLWSTECELQPTCVPLSSAGMSVCWNTGDPGKLMVAEQAGVIRFYDVLSLQPIMSLCCVGDASGLFAADWCPVNPLLVGAVVGREWHVWDTSKATLPEASGLAHSSAAQEFCWSRTDPSVFATRGRPASEGTVHTISSRKIDFSVATGLGRGFTWHNLLQVCAIGGDRVIYVHDIELV